MTLDKKSNPEEVMDILKRSAESLNEFTQEQLAEQRKHVEVPPVSFTSEPYEPTYNFEGRFTAKELEKLGKFLLTLKVKSK